MEKPIIYNGLRHLPSMSCVYAILNQSYNVIYIGTTYDLNKRIEQHKITTIKNYNFNHLRVKILSHGKNEDIEQDYIKKYNPILNVKHKYTNINNDYSNVTWIQHPILNEYVVSHDYKFYKHKQDTTNQNVFNINKKNESTI